MKMGKTARGGGGAPAPAVAPCGRKKSTESGCQDLAAIWRSGSGASSPADVGLTANAEPDRDLDRNTGAGSFPEVEVALRLMMILSKLLVFLRTLSGFLRWAALRAAAFSASEGTWTEVAFLFPAGQTGCITLRPHSKFPRIIAAPPGPDVPHPEAAQDLTV